ncbi:hypothetical protein ACVWZR_008324 [Bradyrhizobium sp. i1.3.1]
MTRGFPARPGPAAHPVILTRFTDSYFKRTDQAIAAGLTCGVAVPVFSGEFLQAVMVLFCGDDEAHVGAIELWHNDAETSHEMALVDGYYGTADMFEFNSRHTRFPRGFGLPGRIWKAGLPLIIKDLHDARSFLRWEDAAKVGINLGVGVPYRTGTDQTWVLTFLSAQATPIARRFEIWVPGRGPFGAGLPRRRLQRADRPRHALCDEIHRQRRRQHRRGLGHRHARTQRRSRA